nr:Cytochrome b oxydase [Physella acuta]
MLFLPSPQNLNVNWNFGSILGLLLVVQILTGFFLSMHYTGDVTKAFTSVVHISRDVQFGWLFRSVHANGASLFFVFLYLHLGRGLYYQSYRTNPSTWVSGCVLYLISMVVAFLGYVLPWGQMSYWGATVITNFMSAIPYVGDTLVIWVWGGFSVGQATLNRFFSLHFILPMVLLLFVAMHLVFLHDKGSSNPLGCMSHLHKTTFHPYYTWKDAVGFVLTIALLMFVVCFLPFSLGDPENFQEANPMVTPLHIMPEWYFLFAYAILRAVSTKLGGVIALIMSIMVLPMLIITLSSVRNNLSGKVSKLFVDKPVPSAFNPLHQLYFWSFVSTFVLLTWLGSVPAQEPYSIIAPWAAAFYFLFIFLIRISGELWFFVSDFLPTVVQNIDNNQIFTSLHKMYDSVDLIYVLWYTLWGGLYFFIPPFMAFKLLSWSLVF